MSLNYLHSTESIIRQKLTKALSPSILEIYNDSYLHKYHAPMKNNTNLESHFRIIIVSDAFKGHGQVARHKIVYNLLKEELENGIHALQLYTKTCEEA
ncbi:hypothetical protein PNEG_03130 [Pneumocystis murina B123]|uniref:BolA-like protein n=1 Tax=Pneumocystis murina (strain B123) TaxID=1069680 RepID=M7NNF5_PNEMU|nr:hypothetical protein PNEG_03130 [Pneumocystis murina B123]EMR08656.1 hypothetical protein PNEG_03130 [Pneumocystis murina B123]